MDIRVFKQGQLAYSASQSLTEPAGTLPSQHGDADPLFLENQNPLRLLLYPMYF
jgi:hypothetical protein